jgi:hypothetical protein
MSERHSMRKIREVLRLKYELGLGHRAIAVSCAIGKASVCDYLKRADKAGLTWAQAKELSDAEIEIRLFRHVGDTSRARGQRSTSHGCTASCDARGPSVCCPRLVLHRATSVPRA